MGRKREIDKIDTDEELRAITQGLKRIVRERTARLEKASRALAESEDKLRAMFESVSDGISIVDLEGKVVEANQAHLRMFGYSRKEELIGKSALDGVAQKDQARVIEEMANLAEASGELGEYRLQDKDGREFDAELASAVLSDSSGNQTGVITVIRDITERKRAEEELIRLSNAVKMATDSIVISDLEASIIDVNEATLRMYGTDDKGDLVGRNSLDLIAPEDREKALAGVKEVLETGYNENVEYHIITKDGGRILVEMSSAIIRGVDGKPIGFVGVSRDITERKRAEEELIRLSNAVKMATDSIVISDLEASIIDVNEATLRMYGTDDKGDLVGRSSLDLIAPEDREKALAGVKEVLETGCNENVEYHIITKDGGRILVELSSAIIRGVDGKPIGFVGVSRDITERKQMEEALRQQTRNLGERVKELGCLYGVAELIEKRDISPEEIAQETIGLIPPAWQYPEITCARITLDSQEFRTENFKETKWKQTQDITVRGDRIGTLEVCYLEERPEIYEGPFLKEESSLIDAIAMQLGEAIERKRMEEALRESEERLRTFIENAPDGIYINDLTGTFVDGNRKAEELVGYSREELIGKNFFEVGILPEEYVQLAIAGLEKNISGEASGPDEFELIRKDGSRVLVEIMAFPIARKGNVEVLGIARDITERKQMEEALGESEQKYRALFESGLEGVFVIDAETMKVVLANQTAARMYGFDSVEDAIGENPLDFVHPDDRERALNSIVEDMFEKELRQVEEFRTITKDGKQKWISTYGTTIEYQGKLAGLVSISDVTERKRAEEALRESEERYRTILEDIEDGYFEVDIAGNFTFFNDPMCGIIGYSRDEMIGMNNRQYMDKQNAKKVYQAFNRVFTTGIPSKESGWEIIRKNGVKRFIEASVSLTKNSEGEPNGFRGIVTDITERKRAEEEIRQKSVELERKNLVLEETTQHLNTLQAITGVGLSPMGLDEMLQELLSHFVQGVGTSFGVIWLLDKERGELRARASLHHEGVELSAEDFTLDIKEPSFGMLLTLTTPLLLEEKDVLDIPMSDKLRKALKDEQVKSVMLVPLTYQGKVIGIACCGWRERREFTPRERGLLQIIAERAATAIEFHRLNEETRQKSVEVEQKNLELMRVNELKSEFLANMSHELRTPMNAIMGYTSLMLRERYGTLTEKQTEALWRVDRNTKNLLSLINNILDLSKIEAGKMPLYNEEVDLRELLEEVIATVEPMVREAKLALETAVAQDIPALWTDRSKLKQTILNLVSNAVKFTPEGGITVSAWSSDRHVKVAVKDTGIGIREEELKVIFDEFRQLDGSTTREQGGTGLGLAIARKFANLLGGDIEVESVYGQGSTFTITIPCSSPPQPPKHIPEPIAEVLARPGTAAKTILAIDDDPEIVALLRENLADTDYEVVGTLSGEEGIKVAAELQPFAITLDILMPHRDGWYVIHKLKNDPKTAHIPVIIISIIEEKHLAYSLGVADYIVKPIERDLLITKLKCLERVGQREAVVVDDDPEVVSLLRDILQGEGYIVRAALSGSDAISQIEAKPPDYLFLDIEMSEMNGFNVLNHVWSKPYGKEMVIVLTSARDLTAEERDFLSKRANIMIGKTDLRKKEAVEKLKLALAAAQVKKGVPGGNEAEDSGGRRQRG